ncbi:AAA family ATPase [Ensifer sp. ENS07]|uniref:TrlF family AAA-like ATPase n=1 Tax=Ensifer sp. ENS07 TaxID=2769274 RepID=UPI00177B0C55|nr:AAA family ATPase [Ensifer sp. ENS07]MBD9638751.1 AAA family ATPase [Ensifer sp. ENS07]
MDKGAHFHRCDFQVHTPRDLRWSGPNAITEEERLAYGRKLIQACRERGIQAIAVTDHHDMTFLPFIRRAASEETAADGSELPANDRLVVFPGMELTLGVPCQALLIFDADFPDDMFQLALNALTITQNKDDEAKTCETQQLAHILSMKQLKDELDKHSYLRDRYIVLPNVTGEGQFSLLRTGQHGKYAEMPWVGGYTDGEFAKLKEGKKNILAGKDRAWGNKRIACIQTSDSRRDDHTTLGEPSTWIKWATPTAEALRQACLAQESRIALETPRVPETYIAHVSVGNSSFLGPLDLDLNPQYNALIGGRGTGKSTLLEYIRWALCDQPPAGDDEDTPNYQARRGRLIDGTLKALGASVQVVYVLNGVPHLVRRAAADGSVQMKIGKGDLAPCTEDEVRALLPIQAYSQKQLSDVSVRVDELTRFITAPIKGNIDRLDRKMADRANHIRETYATRQRFRSLSRLLHNRMLEERSILAQANAIRDSLTGLTEPDRALLDQGKIFNSANALVASWRAGAGTVANKAKELHRLVSSQKAALQPSMEGPDELKQTMAEAQAAYASLLGDAEAALGKLALAADAISTIESDKVAGPWKAWDDAHAMFLTRYSEAMQRSSSHTEKLQQLRSLEAKIAELSEETTRVQETLATLADAEAGYQTARAEWLGAQAERDDLIDRECAALTERSGGLIKVRVRRHANATAFVEVLAQSLKGSRVQSAKIDAIGEAITTASDPTKIWFSALTELETLANFDINQAQGEPRPHTPLLLGFGLSSGDCERIANTLTPEDWLTLSLVSVESVPVYEFRAREGEYISFKNASAGQQATALLKTLLNQAGPPLIIDQPEEDLDNPVMLEIVNQLWDAKQLRQITFASHNANLVVNGDAELVAWFGYRTSDDQSRGTIQGVGAIDVEDTRAAIKQIMEGGEAAFRLRREKYGF